MTKKRKSGGRRQSGATGTIQCDGCGRFVPRDKVKTTTKRVSMVDFKTMEELREQGTIMPQTMVTKNYCVSCAVHRHVVSPRPKSERKDKAPLR